MASQVGNFRPSERPSLPPLEKSRSQAGAPADAGGPFPVIDWLEGAGAQCVAVLPDGTNVQIGSAPGDFEVYFRTPRSLRTPATEWDLGNAYISGEIDIEGDFKKMLDLRDRMRPGFPVRAAAKFVWDLAVRSPTSVNSSAIHQHYTLGDDFYLAFIDSRYRFYSHCLFHNDDESLEEAAEHKLESMWEALGLQPGMRLLDIGGGWGGVAEYCGSRGVHVTSVTLVEDSARYIEALIDRLELPAEVVVSDFLDFESDEPFDHAVIYGVIEHIPNYASFCSKVWEVLKPGGRIYLDASASKEKYTMSPITRRYTWPGHHTFLGLQNIVQEFLFHGFEIVEVRRETRDYELTITHWAERFERARADIVAGWGEDTFRAFRVFLWGGAHAFGSDRLQAYHVVAERGAEPGPRPTRRRRALSFGASLFER